MFLMVHLTLKYMINYPCPDEWVLDIPVTLNFVMSLNMIMGQCTITLCWDHCTK